MYFAQIFDLAFWVFNKSTLKQTNFIFKLSRQINIIRSRVLFDIPFVYVDDSSTVITMDLITKLERRRVLPQY